MPELDAAKFLSQLPLGVLLILILVAGYKGWWIYGVLHRDRVAQEVERRQEAQAAARRWEEIALQNLGLAHRATEVAAVSVATASQQFPPPGGAR